MKKYRITITKNNDRKVLREADNKEEVLLLGNEMIHYFSEEDGILSCIEVEVDDSGNQIGTHYRLIHSWI